MSRIILHSDLNACFASIECMLNPSLKGKPVAVGGSVEERRGIILAKSQEAKLCGVQTAEAIWQAKIKCPELIIIPPHYSEYIKYSEIVRDIYRKYTDLIEPFGIDESWLDVTGSTMLFGTGEEIADSIRRTVLKEVGLTVSVGVSFNKVFAKLGSDLKKPNAVTVISRDSYKNQIWDLPACDMIGVGKATYKKLLGFGIRTIGQLASCDREWLISRFGKVGGQLWSYANGLDISEVKPDGYSEPVKSVGHGVTCPHDLTSCDEVWRVMLSLCQDINRRLDGYSLKATGVQIAVKTPDLITKQFQKKLKIPTRSAFELARAGIELFKSNFYFEKNVRAVTVRAIDLVPENTAYQDSFFFDAGAHERQEKIDSTVLNIRKKYGKDSIVNACLMNGQDMPERDCDEIYKPFRMAR
ncbi:MAG: DNA polymerase IV [Clostridia bacterium]|nr:DNA polymerase IV [Clostridia bacterium]